MLRKTCRVCDELLFLSPLIQYSNMPKSAQFFPDRVEVQSERGADLTVCQCSNCGLVQLSNAPVSYYKEVIRSAAVSEEMSEFRYLQFSNWLESYDLIGKKIIEIGCGSGEYMNIINKFDVDVLGLEQRAESVEKGVKDGLMIQQGFIEDVTPNNGPFDAFYMLNFLEHLPEPNKNLKKIADCLNEGAIGLVEVPNFDMILRQKLFSEFISDHLFYFTKESFVFTLQRNGFEVLECTETWHEYSLSAVVRKRAPISLTIFEQQRVQITAELNSYIDQFNESNVAIWGAGHQALAVISLADIGSRIRYVVDSAPFKQNKYTPASHIPIVPPKTLVSDPVESVIVMAASYSDEVAKLISQNYTGIKIAVLRDTGLEIVKNLTID